LLRERREIQRFPDNAALPRFSRSSQIANDDQSSRDADAGWQ
jgi:hypothetical protein